MIVPGGGVALQASFLSNWRDLLWKTSSAACSFPLLLEAPDRKTAGNSSNQQPNLRHPGIPRIERVPDIPEPARAR